MPASMAAFAACHLREGGAAFPVAPPVTKVRQLLSDPPSPCPMPPSIPPRQALRNCNTVPRMQGNAEMGSCRGGRDHTLTNKPGT